MKSSWIEFLKIEAGLEENKAKEISIKFLEHEISPAQVESLTFEVLEKMGIKIGDILKILEAREQIYLPIENSNVHTK